MLCHFQGAKILLASHFDLEYVLGHKIAFLCIAKGSPRPHITWFKDGVEIFAHHYLHVSNLSHLSSLVCYYSYSEALSGLKFVSINALHLVYIISFLGLNSLNYCHN